MQNNRFDEIKEAVLNGDINAVPALVKKAIFQNVPADTILDKGLIAGMSIVGDKFKCNEIYVPEVLLSAKAMHSGLAILEPLLVKAGVSPKGKVVIGTVKGDLHDIGKNLVSMMLKGAGFSVIDLGIDVKPERFINEVIKNNAQVVAMSSLLTTSMPSMKETIALLKTKNLNSRIKTVIGGAPVTQDYADQINADGYADNASSAVDKIKELLSL